MRFKRLIKKNKNNSKMNTKYKVKMQPSVEEGMFLLASRLDKIDYEEKDDNEKKRTSR